MTGRTIELQANLTDDILEVKHKLQHQEGLDPKSQRLIYARQNLDDSKSLATYNIQSGSTVHLVLIPSELGLSFNIKTCKAGNQHFIIKMELTYTK